MECQIIIKTTTSNHHIPKILLHTLNQTKRKHAFLPTKSKATSNRSKSPNIVDMTINIHDRKINKLKCVRFLNSLARWTRKLKWIIRWIQSTNIKVKHKNGTISSYFWSFFIHFVSADELRVSLYLIILPVEYKAFPRHT